MLKRVISDGALRRSLKVRDLSESTEGPHAMQLLLEAGVSALAQLWECPVLVHRDAPVVSVRDNYDRLLYPEEGAARASRYTRYVSQSSMLRTHTSAMIPSLLDRLAACALDDALLVCPGLVYRRDSIDRWHTSEPHQLDLWRIRKGQPLRVLELRRMIEVVMAAMLPGAAVRCIDAKHPYTNEGLQIEVHAQGRWVEVGECGLALPALLQSCGWEQAWGLAMGLGLDRILMLRKQLPDIRLLRASNARVQSQMQDLTRYREVSRQPSIRRDLSLTVPHAVDEEQLGDAVRQALQEEAEVVEEVRILQQSSYETLAPKIRDRLDMQPGQKNVLLRLLLRDLNRSLTTEEANRIRDRVWDWMMSAYRGR